MLFEATEAMCEQQFKKLFFLLKKYKNCNINKTTYSTLNNIRETGACITKKHTFMSKNWTQGTIILHGENNDVYIPFIHFLFHILSKDILKRILNCFDKGIFLAPAK